MDLKNLFKEDNQASPDNLSRKAKIMERLEKAKNALLDDGMDTQAWEIVRELQQANKNVMGSASERLQEMEDAGVFEGKAGHSAGKKKAGALLGEFREALKGATKELGDEIVDSWDINSGEMSRKQFPEKWGKYPGYEDYFSDPKQVKKEDDIYSEAYDAEHRPQANEYEDTKENTLRDFDRFSKTKEGQILGILQDLDISNLKEKRMGNATPMQIPDPEEPGITSDEARRRRQMLLEMDPAVLSQLEKEAKLMDEIPSESPLELPLEKLKRKPRKVSPEIMEQPTSIPTPTSTGG